MDAVELDLRTRELKLSRRSMWMSSAFAALSFAVSAAAVFFSVHQAASQAKSSADQFDATARATRYNDIVGGLASSAAAVQQNSMRLLVAYAEDRANYHDREAQDEGARDAIQVLTAFIEDNSTVAGHTGLGDFESPQPIIVSRAIDQLKILAGDKSLGSHSADVSRGNFHGVSLPYFRPNGSFLAVAADFRSADLHYLDLSAQPATLDLAFFTCGFLEQASFGKANLSGADFTGADLKGADLSETNVTQEQLNGVAISNRTRLPHGVVVKSANAWGYDSSRCHDLVDNMTGMHGGQGYFASDPCPLTSAAAAAASYRPPFVGDHAKLVLACQARSAGLTRGRP